MRSKNIITYFPIKFDWIFECWKSWHSTLRLMSTPLWWNYTRKSCKHSWDLHQQIQRNWLQMIFFVRGGRKKMKHRNKKLYGIFKIVTCLRVGGGRNKKTVDSWGRVSPAKSANGINEEELWKIHLRPQQPLTEKNRMLSSSIYQLSRFQ